MSDDAPAPEAPEHAAASGPAPAEDMAASHVRLDKAGTPLTPEPTDAAPGPGTTLASVPPPAVQHQPAPPPPVHGQQTIISLPGPTPLPDGPAHPPANPFAPPALSAPLSSYPPPNPFAPPYGQDGAVPPPPIAPDGPGHLPYGYPGVPGYGYPPPPGPYGWPGLRPESNGMGIASMVCGIVAAAGFCLWPLAIVLGVLAVIFGVIGRAKANRGEASNPGHALAGIICGAAGFVLGIGMVLLLATA
ncbi:DUF4190 domain-containing protein [Streptomyces sp. NPDC018693]|uniref:DUF4190 domain-containing protein n=1 Tax=unclassified Streptomyces TaxID=2593676 RepID=UPI0037B51556